MKLCLAGLNSFPELRPIVRESRYQLESFYCFKEWQKEYIHDLDLFLLDSGAFSFINGKKGTDKIVWDDYLNSYIDFINSHDIDHFFELDIDSIVGYDTVKKYTERLEQETKRKCIPVWHKSRGIEVYERLIDEYDYIAIGGIVSGEIGPTDYKYLPKLISMAHKCGTKIHGLGFTSLDKLNKYHFDSVDSTTWIGSRFGHVYKWDTVRQKLIRYVSTESFDTRMQLKDYRDANRNNFLQWTKYQKYLDCYVR